MDDQIIESVVDDQVSSDNEEELRDDDQNNKKNLIMLIALFKAFARFSGLKRTSALIQKKILDFFP
ncbi:hypothetical protein LAZ67_11001973 [Cordylochernes scorpioides]|uniref:Uncharacterized protein n=1 Tax=Cordylochernes scorpioides TaxID=51811 RepID=A0ABY6KYT5_9ARAC|nr:hypothetical protein LAZ67_11001973 [Cordylochernes scorpioides]